MQEIALLTLSCLLMDYLLLEKRGKQMPPGAEHISFSESHFTQDKANGYCQENFEAFLYLHPASLPAHAHTSLPQIFNLNQL